MNLISIVQDSILSCSMMSGPVKTLKEALLCWSSQPPDSWKGRGKVEKWKMEHLPVDGELWDFLWDVRDESAGH